MVRRYTERRHSMRLSVYRYILLLGYALRTNPTYAQNHCVMTNYYRSGGYGLRPNRPYGLCPEGESKHALGEFFNCKQLLTQPAKVHGGMV